MKKVFFILAFVLSLSAISVHRVHAAIATYGTATSSQWTTGANVTVGIPNGGITISEPTLVIVQAFDRGGTPGFQTPAGFTLLAESDIDAIDQTQVFYKNYSTGATLPTTLTVDLNDTGASSAGLLVVAYQGYNATAPFDGTPSITTLATSTSPIVGPGATTTKSNDKVLWTFAMNGDVGATTPSYSTGTVVAEITRSQSSANFYMSMVHNTIPTPGFSGVNTLTTQNVMDQISAITFAIAAPTPVISNVTSTNISTSTATITWTTDIAADSEVDYGTSTAYGLTLTTSTATTSHSMLLTGLTDNTAYHAQVRSSAAGNAATSSDITFTTSQVVVASSTMPSSGASVTVGGGYALIANITIAGNASSSSRSLVTIHSNVAFPVPVSQLRMALSHYADMSDAMDMPFSASVTYDVCPSSSTPTASSSVSCADGTYAIFAKFYNPSSTSMTATASGQVTLGAGSTTSSSLSPEITIGLSSALAQLSSFLMNLVSHPSALSPAVLTQLMHIGQALQALLLSASSH
jgi:hypothetical protein